MEVYRVDGTIFDAKWDSGDWLGSRWMSVKGMQRRHVRNKVVGRSQCISQCVRDAGWQ